MVSIFCDTTMLKSGRCHACSGTSGAMWRGVFHTSRLHDIQTQGEMTQWTLISFTRKARRARGKETTRAKESPEAKAKGKANTTRKNECWERQVEPRKRSEERAETVARRTRRKVAESRNNPPMWCNWCRELDHDDSAAE